MPGVKNLGDLRRGLVRIGSLAAAEAADGYREEGNKVVENRR